jgi:hypothetical protein
VVLETTVAPVCNPNHPRSSSIPGVAAERRPGRCSWQCC